MAQIFRLRNISGRVLPIVPIGIFRRYSAAFNDTGAEYRRNKYV